MKLLRKMSSRRKMSSDVSLGIQSANGLVSTAAQPCCSTEPPPHTHESTVHELYILAASVCHLFHISLLLFCANDANSANDANDADDPNDANDACNANASFMSHLKLSV